MPFEELKQRQAVIWSAGPYQSVSDTIADIHRQAVDRLEPLAGMRFLDLACGTGAVAELAASSGAEVTGVDLAPGLIEIARRRADEQGLDIDYRVGDAEALDLPDGGFDRVTSTCGVMFAPDHAAVARELARVTARGGRIALASWTPDSGVADFFAVMRPFQPPMPHGAGNQFEWGREEYVSELLRDDFDLEFDVLDSTLEMESGQAVWDTWVSDFGPTKTLADSLDDGRREDLRTAFVELHERARTGDGIRFSRTYLLTVGTRR